MSEFHVDRRSADTITECIQNKQNKLVAILLVLAQGRPDLEEFNNASEKTEIIIGLLSLAKVRGRSYTL